MTNKDEVDNNNDKSETKDDIKGQYLLPLLFRVDMIIINTFLVHLVTAYHLAIWNGVLKSSRTGTYVEYPYLEELH